jgi:hypothetical protein
MSFFKNEGQEGKTSPFWGVGTSVRGWRAGGIKERVKEDKYGRSTTYSCMKMEQ